MLAARHIYVVSHDIIIPNNSLFLYSSYFKDGNADAMCSFKSRKNIYFYLRKKTHSRINYCYIWGSNLHSNIYFSISVAFYEIVYMGPGEPELMVESLILNPPVPIVFAFSFCIRTLNKLLNMLKIYQQDFVKSDQFSLTWSCGSRQQDTGSSEWKFKLNNLWIKVLSFRVYWCLTSRRFKCPISGRHFYVVRQNGDIQKSNQELTDN